MTKSYWKKRWEEQVCGITKTRLRPVKNKDGLSYTVFLDCTHGFYRIMPVCPYFPYCA